MTIHQDVSQPRPEEAVRANHKRRHGRPAAFTQTQVTRAARGAAKAGLIVKRVEIDGAGKIVLVCNDETSTTEASADDWESRLRKAHGWEN